VTWNGIQPWQLPIFITVAIVLLEVLGDAVLRTSTSPEVRRRIRTGGLVLLVLLTVVVFVVALGPSLADQLSSVAAFALTGVALFLAFRSYQSTPVESRPAEESQADGAGPEDKVSGQ
jgi:small-conductance mechanosensitive channel